ncbi:MAG TPA: L,D-transpeptidase [Thermoanaerobaculia bacterium]
MQERRRSPRPPLWLNLLLLALALGTFLYARQQRDTIDDRAALLFKRSESSPAALDRMRDELAQMDLTREQLAKELDGRTDYLRALQGSQFYLSIDTTRRKMQFRLGRDVVRECDVVVGEQRTIKASDGRTWTFVPLKGAFTVVGKETDYNWNVPAWLYAMTNQPPRQQSVHNGLGRYVIVLRNNYVIHTPPPPDSPLQGPKPGSFMVPEADLAAIWPRISTETRVYIF